MLLRATAVSVCLILSGCGGDPVPVAKLDVGPATVRLPFSGTARLTATFEADAAGLGAIGRSDEPLVFVHLLDDDGGLLRTFDHPLPITLEAGRPQSYPIRLWQSALGPPIAAGTYRLSLGLYERGGRRWALATAGEEIDDQEYVVARIEVPPVGAGPEVAFSDSWHPRADTDHQTLGARWLEEDGTLELRGVGGPLAVGLTLNIERHEDSGFRLVLDQGDEVPAVELRSDCLAAAARVEGHGRHEVELQLSPAAADASCALEVDANFLFLDLATFGKHSVVLEQLVWTQAELSDSNLAQSDVRITE